MKAGAFEYVTKPFDLDALLASVARATQVPPAVHLYAEEEPATIVGSSPAMLEVWKSIGRVAESRTPVLITGETGVGKELVARAIHAHSQRRDGPSRRQPAALPPLLIERAFGREGPLPAPPRGARGASNWRRTARFFSMKSAISTPRCSPNCCASSKTAATSGSVGRCASFRRLASWRPRRVR